MRLPVLTVLISLFLLKPIFPQSEKDFKKIYLEAEAYFLYENEYELAVPLYLALNDIDHTKTKAKRPQTNGICERFHKTILQEFYQVTFRKKIYSDIDALQADLDDWLKYYNTERTHQGKMCCGKTPMETLEEGKGIP